jgi:hypothetical protein
MILLEQMAVLADNQDRENLSKRSHASAHHNTNAKNHLENFSNKH